jgi:hypothetical protein
MVPDQSLSQGTTSVGPQMPQNKGRALAPAKCSSGISLQVEPFSATSKGGSAFCYPENIPAQ